MNPSVIWDEKHVKALLGLRRHPLSSLQESPWHGWLEERGGIKPVLIYLRESSLSAPQKQLLELIITHPDASTVFYASKLHLGQSAYFARLSDLAQSICIKLNNWKLTQPTRPHNLPAPLTPLIGVEETISTITSIIQRPSVRLLTLMGPGGVGKTRLALATGTSLLEKYRDGVYFVQLETVTDPALLISQIARSLNIETSGAKSLIDALQIALRERQTLLILDNFEQVIEAGIIVTELLQASPQLKIMVTSREALNQYGEYRFIVPELLRPDPENPPPLDQLEQWPAVSLFIQRVQSLHPSFILNETNQQAIMQICHQLDGLPLAIELAAAQVKILAPGQALPTLERGLKNLRDASRARPQRQRTLWDAIHWSYELLPEDEKALFRQLAVFGREWSLEAAQQICQSADAENSLDALANKSLVRYTQLNEDGTLRFQMLQAVREYALEQLINSRESETPQRHATYYLHFVEEAEKSIGTPEQAHWQKRIRQEHENLQIALQWMLDHQETELAFTLLGATWRYWDMLNIWSETRLWMDRALRQGAALRSVARAKTLWGASWLAAHQGDYAQALALAEEGLALARENDEKQMIGRLLQNLADGYFRRGHIEQSIACAEESLLTLRAINDQEETAWALDHLGRGLRRLGEYTRSRAVMQESLSIFRHMGHQWAIAYSLCHAGRYALEDNDDETAAKLLTEGLALSQVLGGKQRISEIMRELALLSKHRGDLEQAKTTLEESLKISHEIGDRTGEAWGLNQLGRLIFEQTDLKTARKYLEKAQALFNESGEPQAIAANQDCLNLLPPTENKP